MIDAKRIQEIIVDCFYREEEIPEECRGPNLPDGAIKAEGIVRNFAFHPDRLKSHEDEIVAMINELPDPFFRDGGGGWAFTNMYQTKDGQHWGEHQDMECLLVLAIGLGKAGYCMSKEFWTGMGVLPYVWFERRKACQDNLKD